MRFTKWMAAATVLVFATSCGSNSTKDKETVLVDTADVSTTTTAPVAETFPVPEPIKTTFHDKYPAVQSATWSRYQPTDYIDWEWSGWPAMDTADYAVSFSVDSVDYWEWYDNDNNWVGTVTTVTDYKGLPAAVNKAIEKDFSGYTITSVDKENDKNRTAYEIELTKGSDKAKALISESGSVLKKKSIVDGEKTKEKM